MTQAAGVFPSVAGFRQVRGHMDTTNEEYAGVTNLGHNYDIDETKSTATVIEYAAR